MTITAHDLYSVTRWLICTASCCCYVSLTHWAPRRNEQHFADDSFKRNFFNANVWISIDVSLRFVPMGSINTILARVQIMVWRRPGDESLSEPMMVNLPPHICVTRPQCVKILYTYLNNFVRKCTAKLYSNFKRQIILGKTRYVNGHIKPSRTAWIGNMAYQWASAYNVGKFHDYFPSQQSAGYFAGYISSLRCRIEALYLITKQRNPIIELGTRVIYCIHMEIPSAHRDVLWMV